MKRLAIILLLLAVTSTASVAQHFPNGLAAEGINPKADSLAILRVRHKLDSIRTTEHRPTVALVLSGGGAKGTAYAGILKYMEEVGIPIDMVCGTSMGGIVGSLIAMGYTADELQDIIRHINWSYLMSNNLESKYVPKRTKDFKATYQLDLPFHYDQAAADRRARMNEENPEEHLERGKRLLASLPTGYVNGYNISNLLSGLTVGYHGNMDFSELPIPYFCVSSDLVTCKAYYAGSGNLIKAVRATMAIPGVFSPVRTDGMILVDGGTRNNFPVDIAKAVGADIIIGVEVGNRDTEYSKVNSIGDIVFRLIAMLGDDARAHEVSKPDLHILPDIGNYGMLSFNEKAVETLMKAGYEAAKKDSAAFEEIRAKLPADLKLPVRKKALNINNTKVMVSDIHLRGVGVDEGNVVKKILGFNPGTVMGAQEIEAGLNRLQATGSFENVSYTLVEDGFGGYSLSVDCMPKQLHRFAFGFRFDTEEFVKAAVDIGLGINKLCGSSIDFALKVGNSQQLDVLYTYKYPRAPSFNVSATLFNRRGDILTGEKNNKFNMKIMGHNERIFLSTSYSTFYNVRAGLANDYAYTNFDWILSPVTRRYEIVIPDEEMLKGDFLSAFITGEIDNYDTQIFPSRGVNLKAGVQYIFHKFNDKTFKAAPVVNIDFTPVIPVTDWFSIIPDLHMRSYLKIWEGSQAPLYFCNYVGGDISGRHLDQQVRFIGLNKVSYAQDNLSVVNLDLQFNPVKNLYISAQGGYFKDSETFLEMFEDFVPDCWAVGAQVGYKTILGPVKFQMHFSSLTKKLECYFVLGFDF